MAPEMQAFFVGNDLQLKVRLQLALERYAPRSTETRVFAFSAWEDLRPILARAHAESMLVVVDTPSVEAPSAAVVRSLDAWREKHPLGRVVVLREAGQPWPSWVALLRPDLALARDLSVGRWQLMLDRVLRPEMEVLLAAPVAPALPPQPEWLVPESAEVELREALAEVRAKALLLWAMNNKPWARAGELPATLWGYVLRRLLGLNGKPLYPERVLWAAPPEIATPERYWIYIRPATEQMLLVMIGAGNFPYAALREQARSVVKRLLTPPPHLRLGTRPLFPEGELQAAEEEPLPPEAALPLFEEVPLPIPSRSLAEETKPVEPPTSPPPIEGL